MKFLAFILITIGITRLFTVLSMDVNEMDKVSDVLDTPVPIDPKTLLYLNGFIGFIETLCALYIIFL